MRIMFIDDEPRRMKPYVDELEDAGHEVLFRDDTDEALKTLRGPSEKFDVVVVDISVAAGIEYKYDDTDNGSRTGIALYDTIKSERPGQKVIVLTNVPDPRLAEHFAKEDGSICLFARKPDILPFQLVEMIEEFVSGSRG
jgi:CheY-like chemotaxis protein